MAAWLDGQVGFKCARQYPDGRRCGRTDGVATDTVMLGCDCTCCAGYFLEVLAAQMPASTSCCQACGEEFTAFRRRCTRPKSGRRKAGAGAPSPAHNEEGAGHNVPQR